MRLVLLALAVALAACQKPQPSLDYQEAESRFRAAMARNPLDPWFRPEMDGVLGLLARVPEDSADREAAEALRRRILKERQALQDEEARRAKLARAAAAAQPLAYNWATPKQPGAAEPVARPAEAPLAPGLALEAFEKQYGDCFAPRSPVRIVRSDGSSVEGQSWALKEEERCRTAHAGEVGKLVLFAGGALLEVRDETDAKRVPAQEQVYGVRRPDGTIAVVGADGKPREVPEGAKLQWTDGPPPGPGAEGARSSGAVTATGGGTR